MKALTRSQLLAELDASTKRLQDLEARGDDACSAYDLMMGYDAEYNKRLARNHIIHWERELRKHPESLQPELF